jgi:hypothetical protein
VAKGVAVACPPLPSKKLSILGAVNEFLRAQEVGKHHDFDDQRRISYLLGPALGNFAILARTCPFQAGFCCINYEAAHSWRRSMVTS